MVNKVAIITGVSRGIGREICILLASKGIKIVGIYRINHDHIKELSKELEQYGTEFLPVAYDLRNPDKIKNIIRITIDKFGKIDFLINCAGIFYRTEFDNIECKELYEVMNVNFISPFVLTQYCAKEMRHNKYGRIINISSLLGVRGYDYGAHYVSSKAALIGLTKSLARELAPYINVNCILPGFIETTNLKLDTTKRRAERIKQIPLKRIGTSRDVANLVCFLISSDADYITGETIEVSGALKI